MSIFIVALLCLTGCIPYNITGKVVTVFGGYAVANVDLLYKNGSAGVAKSAPDGTWRIDGLKGRSTITPMKDGWLFFPQSITASRRMEIEVLAAQDIFDEIAYSGGYVDGVSDLFVMKPDGSANRQLTSSGGNGDPCWSPDGTRIAFTAVHYADNYNSQIHIINADGSGEIQLTDSPGYHGSPSWSPDGSQIVYEYDYFDTKKALQIIDISGGDIRQLSCAELATELPRYSPDGKWIAFVGISEGKTYTNIYKIKPDGSELTQVTFLDDNNEYVFSPSWSPDGKRLAFVIYYSGDTSVESSEIAVIEIDSLTLTTITGSKGHKGGVTWSPDGEQLVFSRISWKIEDGSGITIVEDSSIYSIRIDGSDLRKLSTLDFAFRPCWFPF